MKTKLFLLILVVLLHNSCKQDGVNAGTEYTISGKIYNDCSKSKVYANTPLEVIYEKKPENKILATTTTGADGSFSLTFKASQNYQIVVRIPANDAVQLFSPIKILQFFRDEGLDDGELRSMVNTDFYLYALTDVKVRLQCSKTYTNQDTLYLQPFTNVIHKIVAPQNNQLIEFKGGDPRYANTGSAYGIGWSEFKKASSGVSGKPIYNFLPFRFPPCDKSPMEVVLNLP